MAFYKRKHTKLSGQIHLLLNNDDIFTKCDVPKKPDMGVVKFSLDISEVTCRRCLGLQPEKQVKKQYSEECINKPYCNCKICRFRNTIKRRVINDKGISLDGKAAKKLAQKYFDEYETLKNEEQKYHQKNKEIFEAKILRRKNEDINDDDDLRRKNEDINGKDDLEEKSEKSFKKDFKKSFNEMYSRIENEITDDMISPFSK